MTFIRKIRPCLLCSFVLLTAACQFVPEPVQEQQGSENRVKESSSRLNQTQEISTTVSINPYLDRATVAPAAALEQFDKANQALASSDWALAEEELHRIIETYPEFSGPYLSLALLYRTSGNSDQAERYFREAFDRNSNNVHAYNQYGVFLREQGRFMEAEHAYQRALAVWPQFPEANINLAILYDLYMGRLSLAVEYYSIYRDLQEQPDRRLAGWIVDAQRRLEKQTQSKNGG